MALPSVTGASIWVVRLGPEANIRLARIRSDIWQGYEDRWDLLATRTRQVPVLLPPWLHQRAQEKRVGLPPGHPWNEALPGPRSWPSLR